jgi:hypothetical protein
MTIFPNMVRQVTMWLSHLYSVQNFSSGTYKKSYYHIWLGRSHDTSMLYYLYIFDPNNFFEFFLNFFEFFKELFPNLWMNLYLDNYIILSQHAPQYVIFFYQFFWFFWTSSDQLTIFGDYIIRNHMTSIWCINKHTKTMKLMASLETELFAFQIFSRGQKWWIT